MTLYLSYPLPYSAISLPDTKEPIKSPSGMKDDKDTAIRDLGLWEIMCDATSPPGILIVDSMKSRNRLLLRRSWGNLRCMAAANGACSAYCREEVPDTENHA